MSVQKCITDVGNELIEELFASYFENKISQQANIDTYEVFCSKDPQTKKAVVSVQIYGNAGAPSIEEFKTNTFKFKGLNTVFIERSDIGKFEFALQYKKSVIVNSNDYMIYYESK